MATNRARLSGTARRSKSTQHAGDVDVRGMDPEMRKTLGVDNPYSTPAGRRKAKQQPGESNPAYLKRQRARVNKIRAQKNQKPLKRVRGEAR